MTPGGRIAAAIEILDAIIAPPAGPGAHADHALRDWGRRHRFAGAGDRRAIADLVYDGLRRRRSLGWRLGESGRGLMLALAAESGSLAWFSGEGHAPPEPSDDERAALALAGPPDAAVALDCPAWLESRLRTDLGAAFVPVMLALQQRALLHLRVNRLKTDRTRAIRALAQDHITAVPLDEDPDALAVVDGARLLRRAAAFATGVVEVQDLSSQRVARLARAAPGETLLDYCAGGGGKALAFAAHQGGQGQIFAHDAAPARMGDLPERAKRAGARVALCPPAALPRSCECVFVDAPCSGSGAWRRNPDAKWTLSAADLERLEATQSRILDAAAAHVGIGGRLVYATCSILRSENEAQIGAFLDRQPGFDVIDTLRLLPDGPGDGFFAAEMRRFSPSG